MEKKILYKEYKDALKIVNDFQQQEMNEGVFIRKEKVSPTVSKLLIEDVGMSVGLYNILRGNIYTIEVDGKFYSDDLNSFRYIPISRLRVCFGFGKKKELELIELLDEHNIPYFE